jgi:hypothetical protein
MLTIRLPNTEWAKAWQAMIAVAPVRLIRNDAVYEVLPGHLEVLAACGINYQVLSAPQDRGRLARECAKLDPAFEKALAEGEITGW